MAAAPEPDLTSFLRQGRLLLVGYWRSPEEEQYPDPRTLVGAGYPPDLRDRICRYLRAGVTSLSYMGYSNCRFSCGVPDHEMGTEDLTDSTWVWPEGLVHYVEKHDIELPAGFVRTMEDHGWLVPRDAEALASRKSGDSVAYETAYWLEWAAWRGRGVGS